MLLRKKYFARRGDAKYVQLIHTSGIMGTLYRTGDCDIVVGNGFKQKGQDFVDSHICAIDLCYLIAAKFYAFVVSKNETKVYDLTTNSMRIEDIPVGKDECMVGMYNTDRKYGKFKLKISIELFKHFNEILKSLI